MMMEITFKTLDRVTVNGLYNKNTVADITSFAYCVEDNTYYLLDDPIVLQKREDIEVIENGYYKIVIKDKDEAKVSIVTCDTLKEVYKQLINRLARNDLNPFILYKKFKEGYVTGNVEIDVILASADIPDDIIEEMIEDIVKAEKNHPDIFIFIGIDILKGIDEVLKKIKENQELLKDKHITIKDIVNDLTVKGYKSITYPRYHTLVRFIEELINDEKKKLERLMKKQEEQRQQQQGTTNQSSSGQQQQLEGGTSSGSTTSSNAGIQGSPSPKPNTGSDNNNNNNNNSNGSDNISSSSGSAGFGSGVSSLQLYVYTFRVIVPTSLKRSEVNEIITSIKRIRSDAKVEVV
jgi:hypothetical protein